MRAGLKGLLRAIIRPAAVRGTGLRRTVERAIVAVAASLIWITAAAVGMEAAAMPLSADAHLEETTLRQMVTLKCVTPEASDGGATEPIRREA